MVHSHDFYTQYQSAYEKYTALYGQVCVFLQKGSFYEIYGQQDPKTLKYLNTGRQIMEMLSLQIHVYPEDGPNGTVGFYGGIPIYTLDKWASRLTSQGWSVVVIDEVKNGSGKVSKREVTRVLSPGTHVDSAESSKAFILASLWLETAIDAPPKFGVAAADLTTGQIILYDGQATGKTDVWHTDDLRHFFQVYAPKELLVYVRGPPLTCDDDTLRRTFYIPKAPIHIVSASPDQQGAFEKPLVREDYLRKLFQPKSSLPLRTWLRCANESQERALVMLLRFAEDHAPKLAECLQAPQLWYPTQSLQVINNALTQLNLVGGSEQCVEDLFATPVTAMGKRSLTARLCSPVADAEQILKRQEEVGWILSIDPALLKSIESALAGVYDVSRLHRSIVRGTVKANDALQLYQSYESVVLLCDLVAKAPFSDTAQIQTNAKACAKEFTASIDIQKAVKAQENPEELGFLLDSVGPNSAVAEARVTEIYSTAAKWLKTLLEICSIEGAAVCYKPTEKNMFSVHCPKTVMKTMEQNLKTASQQQAALYKQLQFKSLTSAGRLEHPQLEKFQEQLDSAKAALHRAAAVEIPAACIQYISVTRTLWQSIEDWILNLDLALTMAKTAKAQGWVKPEIQTTEGPSRLKIQNLRHPLIEIQKKQSKYVTHDVSLGYDTEQGWLLYGMNASGKSSLMKAIGLATLLAQIGSYVPATAMTIRPFRRIATRILNQDNLWAGLSSFAVEMSELREILAVADEQTLVLGDELCAGTESISGTAIVAAGIQHLCKAGARFVLATHLHDLMKLPPVTTLSALKVWHLHVEYDPVRDLLVYHRTLRPGAGSSMYGLEVAKALHLPRDMIEAAFEMRRTLLGTTAAEDAKDSSWSSSIARQSCSACGADVTNLEVHHLQERSKATNGRNQDGTALNHVRNLSVLCSSCHDKHHSGHLVVGPVEDTSDGPRRTVLDLSRFVHEETSTTRSTTSGGRKSPFSEEQIQSIKQLVQSKPGLTPRLWCFQIRQELGTEITESQFKTLQKKGLL
jgi:DNA mismatch repair protein MutS